eukprot:Gregarina_sp_Poly_1__341@NODE_1082_length_5155_cov_239_596895_g751_i0_p1_GENE_NODE_1082_length_5155_cov_239_596895_g751_i0NODE_1082_length_5155_cov_239_596895_g751_i0_p1_ORF_typecomplete_len1112_score190_76Importin_rep_4/PF18808_1/7_8e02Importin_rep_4/PF18808_1/2_8e24Vac14_Fab1_bd/PF12755_7/26Vac14_Fab1_bd/PF12755_7/1Vac14_Fab1_bd/PF12755_7/2_6e08Vac14_Fab1_bd/PF12755_7/0_26Vac14_Fab1_bd/PF12755_7/1_1e03Vac14_Fab1_bd/PF12755_7/1_8Vac14_Fab1_bd/PF12755_7/43Vac14_Fab1_bd/PF12755_7/45Vac14_Fab1_bd/
MAVEAMMACDNVGVQVLGLTLCANLESQMASQLCDHMPQVSDMLKQKLGCPEPELRLAAIGLMSQIIANEQRKHWRLLENLVPLIIDCLLHFASMTEEDYALDLLQKMTEIAETSGEFFKLHLERFVSVVLEICADEKQAAETRQMAMEFLLTLIDGRPKMVQKVPLFLSSVVRQLMCFMLSLEDDEEWYQRELTAESDEETRNYDVGEYGLDRLAQAVGGEIAIPIVFQHVATFLKESTWQHQVAGIVAISQTIEYLPEDEVESKLGQIVDLLLKQTGNAHCRVRFAACRALGQISLDHQPFVQQTQYETVLPALIAMFDDSVPRVQSQAFAAFINFAEEVAIEDLRRFVPQVMAKVMARLENPLSLEQQAANSPQVFLKQGRSIREQCITCVAVIAGVLGKEFVPYCGTWVPLMQEVARQANNEESKQLQGRAFECLSIIAYAVELEGIQALAESIVKDLLTLFNMPLQSDDPRKEYVQEALRRMIRVLRTHFAPFLSNILPSIFDSFVIAPDTKLLDPDEKDFTMICLSSGVLSCVKTSKLEDIEKNLQVLCTIVECLKSDYARHCEHTMSQLLPLLDIQMTDTIKVLALSCIAEVLRTSQSQPELQSHVKKWTLAIMNSVFRCASDEDETAANGVTETASYVAGLVKCMEAAGPNILDGTEIRAICEKALELIEQSGLRREMLRNSMQGSEFDEEDVERCEKELEKEQLYREKLLCIFEALMKHHPEKFVECCGELLLRFIHTHIEATQFAADRTLAIFVCCDALEQLGASGVSMVKEFLPQIVICVTDECCATRQAASYAISLVSVYPDVDPALILEAIRRLIAILRDPGAADKVNRDVTENACSALVALIICRPTEFHNQLQDVVDLCVQHLPFRSDIEEGRKVHKKVLQQLQQERSVFWGRDQANVPRLMRMMGAIYKTEFSDDESDDFIRQLVKKLGLATLVALSNDVSLLNNEKRGIQKLALDLS